MGHWSVYCSSSRISISSGPAVFIPLFKNKRGGYESYMNYAAYTLPIFGEYDTYGRLENIEEDFNTKLIEEKFKCKIEDFVEAISTGDKIGGVKDIEHMWVQRDVYDFLTTYKPDIYGRRGDFDLGNPVVLNKLGFTETEKNDDERYNRTFTMDDYKLTSDGTWLNKCFKNDKLLQVGSIYNLENLKDLIPEVDVSYFEDKEEMDIFELYEKVSQRRKLFYWPLGFTWMDIDNRFSDMDDDLIDEMANSPIEEWESIREKAMNRGNRKDFTLIQNSYFNMFGNDEFCQRCADLVRFVKNGRIFSTTFEPYIQYQTPQDGEHQAHQVILEKFAEINKSILVERGYDEYEE